MARFHVRLIVFHNFEENDNSRFCGKVGQKINTFPERWEESDDQYGIS